MDSKESKKTLIKKIFIIALPLILQQFFYQMQVLVDRAMLGKINSEYFSAVGNALFPFNTIWAVTIAICGGTTIMIAQYIGAKKKEQAKRYAESSLIGNSCISILFFLIFFLAPDVIFKIMGVKSPILEYSISFARILSFSLILLGAETTACSVLQGIGRTKIILYTGLLKNVLNIFFDWILIFGNLGFPQLNLEGAAYATTLSNLLVAPIIIIYIFKSKKLLFNVELKNILHVKWNLYKETIKVGLPSGVESLLWNVGNLVVIFFLNKLDIMAAGIYSLIFSLEVIPFFIYSGLARAAMTLVGQNTGANNEKEALNVGFKCMRVSFVFCLIFAALFISFPKEILSIFTNDQGLIDESVKFLIIVSFTMFPKAVNNVIGLGIQGLGDTKWMLYGQILGTTLVITLSYLFIFKFDFGLVGLFVTFFADEFFRGILNAFRFWKGREFFFLKPFQKIINSDVSIES